MSCSLRPAWPIGQPTAGKLSTNGRSQDELVFVPLGGLGEIGMNAALYGFGPEDRRQWVLVDCGMGFASEEHMPGVDLMFPDLRFLEDERRNLLGIVHHACP